MNLAQYTLPQLKQLDARIAKELARRQAASKLSLLKRLRQLAQEHGVTFDEVVKGTPAQGSGRTAVKSPAAPKPARPAKYRHPNNIALAWTGRGRKPYWVEAWLANGGSLDALEVAAQKLAHRSPAGQAHQSILPASLSH